MTKKTPRLNADQQDLRRRMRAHFERTGMTYRDFGLALGKKSGSVWTSQFLTGEIVGTSNTIAAIEALIAPPAPPVPTPPAVTALPDDQEEWPTAVIAAKLRVVGEQLGVNGRSVFTLAADRLDTLGRFVHQLRADTQALTKGT